MEGCGLWRSDYLLKRKWLLLFLHCFCMCLWRIPSLLLGVKLNQILWNELKWMNSDISRLFVNVCFPEVDITRDVEWKRLMPFLRTEADITRPEPAWIKFPFVAVPSQRSKSHTGSKLIASWKHLIAACVLHLCKESRGIESKRRRWERSGFSFNARIQFVFCLR